MGKSTSLRQRLLRTTFWFKTLVSLILSIGVLGLMSWQIYSKYRIAIANRPKLTTSITVPPGGCAISSERARLEPQDGIQMVGFHLDWAKQTPIQLKRLIDFNPAIINAFVSLNTDVNPPINLAMFEWHAQEARRVQAILAVTIEPTKNPTEIHTIPQNVFDDIARMCLKINTDYGTGILLRYGHEMNGNWANYGMKPAEFKLGFRRMTDTIRRYTNMTAMVWGPNLGVNYPFGGSGGPVANRTDFIELDTNNDGILDFQDDPYTPYYPGDEYVDWVALSLYWYPDAGTGFNTLADPNFFVDQLTATGASTQRFAPQVVNQANRNFYNMFCVQRGKPMYIPETSAPYVPAFPSGGATNSEIKQNWWRQVFSDSVRAQYPKLKGAVWFEETKSDGQEIRNWQITDDAVATRLFSQDMKLLHAQSKIAFGENLLRACNGDVSISFTTDQTTTT